MFVKQLDVDLEATLAKEKIKHDKYKKKLVFVSSCINAECVCVCICSSAGPHWHYYRSISQLLEKQTCEAYNAVS